MGTRPPYETFSGPTCRGSYALGTACGHCEKCTWERERMAQDNADAAAQAAASARVQAPSPAALHAMQAIVVQGIMAAEAKLNELLDQAGLLRLTIAVESTVIDTLGRSRTAVKVRVSQVVHLK